MTDNVDAFDADGRLAVADGGNGDLELGRHHLMTHIPCGQYQTLESLTTLLGAPKTYKGDDGVLFKAATHAGSYRCYTPLCLMLFCSQKIGLL